MIGRQNHALPAPRSRLSCLRARRERLAEGARDELCAAPMSAVPEQFEGVSPLPTPAPLPRFGADDEAIYSTLPRGAKYIAPDGLTRVKS